MAKLTDETSTVLGASPKPNTFLSLSGLHVIHQSVSAVLPQFCEDRRNLLRRTPSSPFRMRRRFFRSLWSIIAVKLRLFHQSVSITLTREETKRNSLRQAPIAISVAHIYLRSSAEEQRPFKALVEGPNPSGDTIAAKLWQLPDLTATIQFAAIRAPPQISLTA